MRILKRIFAVCAICGLVAFLFFKGMEYYPQLCGKKMTISATLPEKMSIAFITTDFEGINCKSWPPMQFARERVKAVYDEATQTFSAEAPLEHYSLMCQWEPVEFQLIATHPDSLNDKGEPKSFLLARLGIWRGLDEKIKAETGRMFCRRYDINSLPKGRYFTTLSCYNPDLYEPAEIMYPVFSIADDNSFSFVVEIEEKSDGEGYNFLEDPVILEKYPYLVRNKMAVGSPQ